MRKKFFFFLALIAAIVVVAIVMLAISQSTGVTKQSFEKIKVGMHRDEVNAIFDTEDFTDDVSNKLIQWSGRDGSCCLKFDEMMRVSHKNEWFDNPQTIWQKLQDISGPKRIRNRNQRPHPVLEDA